MERAYSRCAGSVPKAKREELIRMIHAVGKVSTLQELWVSLGMEAKGDDDEVIQRIGRFLKHLDSNSENWGKKEADTTDKVVAPEVLSNQFSSTTWSSARGPVVLKTDLQKKREGDEKEEREKHKGYPSLDKKGDLSRFSCQYAGCGKKFACRDALFRHLRKMIEPERMLRDYHQKHFKMAVKDLKKLTCDACGLAFPSSDEIYEHYAEKGVRGAWPRKLDRMDNKASSSSAPVVPVPEPPKPAEPAVDPDSDLGVCIICMEKAREVVNIPCGHLICCNDCGHSTKECPMCRVEVRDVVRVYYS